MGKLLLACCILLIVAGCSTPSTGVYSLAITGVRHPANAAERYGNVLDKQVAESPAFKDEFIRIELMDIGKCLNLKIRNEGNYTVRVLWDQAVMVTKNNVSCNVIHKGVGFENKGTVQIPSVIAPGTEITDMLIPKDGVKFQTSNSGGFFTYKTTKAAWIIDDILPCSANSTNQLNAVSRQNLGVTMKLIMPVEIKGVVNDYEITFKTTGFTIDGKRTEFPYVKEKKQWNKGTDDVYFQP